MIFVVYLGHETFDPMSVLLFSPNQFLGEVLSSHIEELEYVRWQWL